MFSLAVDSKEIKLLLDEKNITQLFHVNTVPTTISYLEAGGLLSRGAVEDLQLFQTSQASDKKDKELGIWYDIFFDSVDIHERTKDLNKYGPLTLVFNNDFLLLDNLTVKITRDNPIRWDANWNESQRYFEDIDSLRSDYQKGAFAQHLTLCGMNYALPFSPYLKTIVMDNPKTENNELFENAYHRIENILVAHYSNVELLVRECPEDCSCTNRYNGYQPGAIWHKYHI